ncbi:hypothetical protein ACP4OV_028687 [Aristida adscensionis]
MQMQMQMEMENREAAMETMVFGRRRPRPPSESPELETERSRSAKTKNDPLSVYEATLLKLRHASVQAFMAPLDGTKSLNASNGVAGGGGDDDGALQNKLRTLTGSS